MKIRINEQKILSIAIVYMVSFLGLLNGINAITNVLGFNTSADTFVMYAILWAMAVFIYIYSVKNSYLKIDVFFVFIVFILLFIGTLLFFPENTEYILSPTYTYANNPIIIFFLYSIPGYIAIRNLKDYQDLMNYLRVGSYVVIIISAIIFFGIKDTFANHYMTLSYNMLLQVCFLVIFSPQKKRILNYIIVGVGVFIVLIGGARGAAVGLIIAIILHVLETDKESITKRTLIKIVLLFVTGGIVLLFYKQIFVILVSFISDIGIISRNVELIIYSTSDISSGRFGMFSQLMESINVVGRGLYGDRVILDGMYAHNLFFEWLIEFGFVLGSLFIVLYGVLFIGGYKKGNEISKKLILVFIPNGMIALMFSGSYLGQQPAFFILSGLCVNVLLQEHRRKR